MRFDVDLQQPEAVENTLTTTSQTDSMYLTPLTSGNCSPSTFISQVKQGQQDHYVQTHVSTITHSISESKETSVSGQDVTSITPVKIDPGTTNAPVNPGSLSSALKGLNLVGNVPTESSLISGPFQIIAHTGNIHAAGMTDLQILDDDGKPIQVPVQLVTTADNQCSIHLLSLAVESDDKEPTLLPNNEDFLPKEEKAYEINETLKFDQPSKTSTPAVHIGLLDDTILAGNINGNKPVHGPTPVMLPTPDTPLTPVTLPTPVTLLTPVTPPTPVTLPTPLPMSATLPNADKSPSNTHDTESTSEIVLDTRKEVDAETAKEFEEGKDENLYLDEKPLGTKCGKSEEKIILKTPEERTRKRQKFPGLNAYMGFKKNCFDVI